jgi:hypothetical protein
MVAPAALAVLRALDQADRLLELLLHVLVAGHAVDLGEEQRCEAVRVHDAVRLLAASKPDSCEVLRM